MKIENMAALRNTLERMETPQLDALLLEDLRKEAPNAELIRMISNILKERDRNLNPEIDANIQEAWEQYQRKTQPTHRKPKHMNHILVHAASFLLVILTLIALFPQTAEASNFFQRFIAWTEDVFSFVNPSEETVQEKAYVFRTDNPGLQQVYDTVVKLGITDPVVPMWLPEEYTLGECVLVDNPTKRLLTATFSNGQWDVVYQVKLYSDNTTSAYYKDGEILQEKEMHGTTYTILRNQDFLTAAWTTNNKECFISIDCPEDTLIRILESIYTMEDD